MTPRASKKLCTRCKTVQPAGHSCANWQASRHAKRSPASTRRWRKLRAAVLTDEPLCRACGTELATEVDHIRPISQGGDQWDRDNLQPLCTPCHRAKTQAESRHARGEQGYAVYAPTAEPADSAPVATRTHTSVNPIWVAADPDERSP